MSKMFDLTGRTVVVTGSTKGIGLAIARAAHDAGADVVISSRDQVACDDVANAIDSRAGGGRTIGIACDVGDRVSVERLIGRAVDAFRRIDCLVLNAGVSPFRGPMAELPDEAFQAAMTVNVQSAIWACNKAAPFMQAQGGGSLIVLSSIGGLRGTKMLGAYAISKAAVMQLVRNLAVEWGPANIRANAIAPGLIKTDFASRLWQNPDLHDRTVAAYPLRRLGEPDDLAGLAILLASDAGSFVSGQTIVVDGGAMANGPY